MAYTIRRPQKRPSWCSEAPRPAERQAAAVGRYSVNAKAAAVAFLHSGAWVVADAENWRYVVQYADGREEVVRMIGRKNIADWTDMPKDKNFNQDPAAGWTRTAVTVHTSKYPNVSLYGTIWRQSAPR